MQHGAKNDVTDNVTDNGRNSKVKLKRNKVGRIINIVLIFLAVFLLCFLLIKIFFVTRINVNLDSMFPTYKDSESVFINRLGEIERGCVAVYFDSDVSAPRLASTFSIFSGGAKLLIKRIVATSGDKLWLEYTADGYRLKILCADSDKVIDEEYTDREGKPVTLELMTLTPTTAGVLFYSTSNNPYTVGEECVFVMGDNRTVSQDSRASGDVPIARIIGTAIN